MPICVQIIEWVYNHMADGKKRESLRKIIDGKQVTVRYLDYDWSSNSKWLHVEKEILSIDIDSFSVTIDLLPLAFKASYKETMYFFNHVLQLVMFMCIIDWEREGKERERDRERTYLIRPEAQKGLKITARGLYYFIRKLFIHVTCYFIDMHRT